MSAQPTRHSRVHLPRGAFAQLLGFVLSLSAIAQTAAAGTEQGPTVAENVIRGDVLRASRGAIGVNQAAGDGNLQANSAAIAVGIEARTSVTTRQHAEGAGTQPGTARTRIDGDAFSGARGWLAINQSAGGSNLQSNAIAVKFGIQGSRMDAKDLAEVKVSQTTQASPDQERNLEAEVGIGQRAFRDARGVVQINQSAGSGNATSNRFELRMTHAVEP